MSTADISKTEQLAPKLSRWMNCPFDLIWYLCNMDNSMIAVAQLQTEVFEWHLQCNKHASSYVHLVHVTPYSRAFSQGDGFTEPYTVLCYFPIFISLDTRRGRKSYTGNFLACFLVPLSQILIYTAWTESVETLTFLFPLVFTIS